MPSSQILAYPSVSANLDQLQYQTNPSKVPVHSGPNGRAGDSQEMLKRGLAHVQPGHGRTSAVAGYSSSGSSQSGGDALMMRSRK